MASKYVALSKQSFNESLAYRANYYTGLARELFFLYMSVLLWQALYQTAGPVPEASLHQVVTYIGMSRILGVARNVNLRPLLEARIISGDISTDLIRPFDFPTYLMSRAAGTAVSNILMRCLPMLLVAFFAFGAGLPSDGTTLVLFLVSATLAFAVSFQIDFMVCLLAFWTTEMWSFTIIKTAMVTLLSGALIPLWFYPEYLRIALEWLPFSSIVYAPATIYVGNYMETTALMLILRQIGWLAVLILLSRLVWRKAVVKLSVQGG